MRVSSYGSGDDRHIAVSLGNGGIGLTLAEATELRDALTRELGEPPTLTAYEAMVWAAEFVRALAQDVHVSVAAQSATNAVRALRCPEAAGYDGDLLSELTRDMLVSMTGGDR